MIIDLGNHTIECDFDPRIQCNNSADKLPIEDIGFIYNCVFKQRSAAIRSIEATREVYPNSKTYLVSDGGLDYSFLEDENLKFSMQEDTVLSLIHI